MSDSDESRVLVINPKSGSEAHADRIAGLGREHGFDVRRTESPGDGEDFAAEAAADGADLVAAAGGDGTLNEVVNGVHGAQALDRTDVAVVPAGTGNNFASNVGVDGIEAAFEAVETGERRAIDLGVANDRAFANSCVGGITAEASGETTPSGKRQFGVLAYVMNTLETVREFDGLPLRVETAADFEDEWTGKAMFVLVGNCRRFSGSRRAQANVEDGLFEVIVVGQASAADLVGEAALEGLLGRETDHIVKRRTPSLTVEHLRDESVEYSLDGEILEAETLALDTVPSALTVVVGDGYDPDPDGSGR